MARLLWVRQPNLITERNTRCSPSFSGYYAYILVNLIGGVLQSKRSRRGPWWSGTSRSCLSSELARLLALHWRWLNTLAGRSIILGLLVSLHVLVQCHSLRTLYKLEACLICKQVSELNNFCQDCNTVELKSRDPKIFAKTLDLNTRNTTAAFFESEVSSFNIISTWKKKSAVNCIDLQCNAQWRNRSQSYNIIGRNRESELALQTYAIHRRFLMTKSTCIPNFAKFRVDPDFWAPLYKYM